MNRSETFDRLKVDRMKYNKYVISQHSLQSEIYEDMKFVITKSANDSRYK
jgi:hypothetical protein